MKKGKDKDNEVEKHELKTEVEDLKHMVEKLINLLPNKAAEKDAEWSKVLDEAKNETPSLVQDCHGAFLYWKGRVI